MDFKTEYEKLLVSGMFWVIFPDLTGVWEKDMPAFIEFKVTAHAHIGQ